MAPFNNRLLFCVLALYLRSTAVLANDDDISEATVEVESDPIEYVSPSVNMAQVYLADSFDDPKEFQRRWVTSKARKDGVDEDLAKYDGLWEIQKPERRLLNNDLGLVLMSPAKHSAISTIMRKPFVFNDKPLIVQYEVTMQDGQNCGGAYIKLLSEGTNTKEDLSKFNDQTPYTIMFGPDKCGNDNKLHFIFRHKNPQTGVFEEKHSDKTTTSAIRLEDTYKDKEPHLYTLILRPDNTFTIKIDNTVIREGSLLENMTPPVNPPEQIPDPADVKPADWEDKEKISDPLATKPDDWDEEAPAKIPDPNAVKPAGWLDDEPETIPDSGIPKPLDWDEDIDGEWEAPLIDNPACKEAPGCGPWAPPMIPNPEYKGKWRAPLIPNPNYKGPWVPRFIPNPDYFNDENPFRMTTITAVGFELWSMSNMLLFDNIIITDDSDVADQWAKQTFDLKRAKLTRLSETAWDRMLHFAKENPWVYGIVGIATAGILYFIRALVRSKTSESDENVKKTDAIVEDDPHQSSGDEEGDQEEEEAEAEEEGKPSKQQLESPEADKQENVEETEPLVDAGAGDGQRKRKPRKE